MSFLQGMWFFVIGLLFAGFLLLEGFDFGVGMATRFLARDGDERALFMRAIGPHWDGNEVWLITAGGAMFAAFPLWYASLFSGYYLLLFLVLVALILRGVSFEFANNAITDRERGVWQWANFIGSFFAPFFLGMMLTSFIQGVPMDDQGNAWVGFFGVFNWLSVVGGVAVVFFCFLHGLHFLSLKLGPGDSRRMLNTSEKLYWIAYPALVIFVVLAMFMTDFYRLRPVSTWLLTVVILAATICGHVSTFKKRGGYAFTATGVTLMALIAWIFNGIFPRVMVATDPSKDLLIKDAAASPYTLKIMTIVLCIFLPIMLAYFIWSYFIQRKRLVSDDVSMTDVRPAVVAG
ncbi:cytochrome D ubiquinol oxidase subunit II [Bifidobacterium actinocoloniiforme DSM 22766]|uniref:Cytochrome D ubiquinol oxidase subunit II n=1 Tax=Bifidobacterium actinocoloniiforme DSM 22766 TaxID=1437605 RepID=A0A086Z1V3_9BIFI|nr:cytochrome d ubiquinol oxidase subunit II [Bifidobacterium actinocoloniiforme]AKV55604.1 cytochrome C oxidase assembly protein [Bifidobacterium actinocoloniiforme DSM 22766]KFI40503.1 cytochrome D ubiquinol oxidase subunit II [Bifidobacterium actinocoloniiforme DSM 22766]